MRGHARVPAARHALLAAPDAGGAGGGRCSRTAAGWRPRRPGCSPPPRSTALLALGPPGPPATMSPSVFALLDEARWLIDPELRTYGHVVIDEAQNLTAMELRMIVRRARAQSVTVLGDIAQRTAEAGTERWERVLGDAGVERVRARRAARELPRARRLPPPRRRRRAGRRRRGAGGRARRAVARRGGAGGRGRGRRGLRGARRAHGGRGRAAWASSSPRRCGPSSTPRWPASPRRRRRTRRAGCRASSTCSGCARSRASSSTRRSSWSRRPILAERPDGGAGGLYTALTRSTRALAVVHADELPPALAAAPSLRRVAAAGGAGRLVGGRRG